MTLAIMLLLMMCALAAGLAANRQDAVTRVFVSFTGMDAGLCSEGAPCKTLGFALALRTGSEPVEVAVLGSARVWSSEGVLTLSGPTSITARARGVVLDGFAFTTTSAFTASGLTLAAVPSDGLVFGAPSVMLTDCIVAGATGPVAAHARNVTLINVAFTEALLIDGGLVCNGNCSVVSLRGVSFRACTVQSNLIGAFVARLALERVRVDDCSSSDGALFEARHVAIVDLAMARSAAATSLLSVGPGGGSVDDGAAIAGEPWSIAQARAVNCNGTFLSAASSGTVRDCNVASQRSNSQGPSALSVASGSGVAVRIVGFRASGGSCAQCSGCAVAVGADAYADGSDVQLSDCSGALAGGLVYGDTGARIFLERASGAGVFVGWSCSLLTRAPVVLADSVLAGASASSQGTLFLAGASAQLNNVTFRVANGTAASMAVYCSRPSLVLADSVTASMARAGGVGLAFDCERCIFPEALEAAFGCKLTWWNPARIFVLIASCVSVLLCTVGGVLFGRRMCAARSHAVLVDSSETEPEMTEDDEAGL